MSVESSSQNRQVVVETSQAMLEEARELADINLVLLAADRDDESEIRRKMERVRESLDGAQDSLIADADDWAGDRVLSTETQQVTLNAEIPSLLADLIDVYFEEVGETLFDDPAAKQTELYNELGDLVEP